jgi:hypothetical protein
MLDRVVFTVVVSAAWRAGAVLAPITPPIIIAAIKTASFVAIIGDNAAKNYPLFEIQSFYHHPAENLFILKLWWMRTSIPY